VPKPEKGRIDAPLVKQGETMIVAKGKQQVEEAVCLTIYQVVERALKQAAFVALWPFRGVRISYACIWPISERLCWATGFTAATTFRPATRGAWQRLAFACAAVDYSHPRRGVMIDVVAPLGPGHAKNLKWFNFDEKHRGGLHQRLTRKLRSGSIEKISRYRRTSDGCLVIGAGVVLATVRCR